VQFSDMWRLLDGIQAQIRAFDAKAQVALGIDGVLTGFVGAQLLRSVEYPPAGRSMQFLLAVILAGLALLSLVTSVVLALRTVYPHLELKQPSSHFFFGDIVQMYGRNYAAAAVGFRELSDDDAVQELGIQLLVNSIICTVKATRVRGAVRFTAGALCLYVLSVIPFASLAYHGANITRSQEPCGQIIKSEQSPSTDPAHTRPAERTSARNPQAGAGKPDNP